MTTPSPSPRTRTPRPSLPAFLAATMLLAGCAHNPPGVGGVAGTAPAPGVFWRPPRREPAPQEAGPLAQIPPGMRERVQQLKLSDVVDIALRNNTATSAAWAQARAAAAAYGAARGLYYPSVTFDGSVTPLRKAPFSAGAGGTQRTYGPALNLSWLLLDFGARGGAIGEAREALLAADWTHNAVIQDVVLGVQSA